MIMDRYNKLNTFLKNKFGERVLKICVDGGFTCPNRDGKCGRGGCIFCGERGSGEHTKRISIADQVNKHLQSYRGQRAGKFVVYFQNFTNTYDTIENLKQKYDQALVCDKIVGLAIATRPDCIDEAVAKLLAEYQKQGLYVWVELGLQTTNDKVGKFINRGYSTQDFVDATKVLRKYNIDIIAHIMLGLPNEEENDLQDAINFVNEQDIQGLKIHSTYVIEGTALATLYKDGKYQPIQLDDYIEKVLNILQNIRPEIVVHRITGDAPKDLLLAPSWSAHKKLVLNRIENIMASENLSQGVNFKK